MFVSEESVGPHFSDMFKCENPGSAIFGLEQHLTDRFQRSLVSNFHIATLANNGFRRLCDGV